MLDSFPQSGVFYYEVAVIHEVDYLVCVCVCACESVFSSVTKHFQTLLTSDKIILALSH